MLWGREEGMKGQDSLLPLSFSAVVKFLVSYTAVFVQLFPFP